MDSLERWRNGAVSSCQAGAHWKGKVRWEDGGEWELSVQHGTRPAVRWEIDV